MHKKNYWKFGIIIIFLVSSIILLSPKVSTILAKIRVKNPQFAATIYSLPTPSSQINVTSPTPNSTVKGTIPLSASLSGISGVSKVQYLLNDKRMMDYKNHELIDVITASPFSYSWPTQNVWDGPQTIRAVALDANNNIIAVSAEVPFTIQNTGKTIELVSPAPGTVLSGTVPVTIRTNVNVDAAMFSVDGVKQDIKFLGESSGFVTVSFSLDTTKFENGTHEIYVAAMDRNKDLFSANTPAAQVQKMFKFENGKKIMDLRGKFNDLFLIPGESSNLSPSIFYTDGSHESVNATFTSENNGIASVDSNGNVRAVSPGVATINISAQGKNAKTRVVVLSKKIFPHFGKDGSFLTSYDPTKSLFVRSLFVLDANALADNNLASEIKKAGVNTFEGGIYLLPADAGNASDFATYKKHFDGYFDRVLAPAVKWDMSLLMTGDNIARSPEYVYRILNESWASEALKYSFTRARDSKRVIGVEMIDESSGMWGGTPKPATDWQKNCGVYKNCTIPKDAFVRIVNTLNEVTGRPMISWPILWFSGAQSASKWMGDPQIADYGSHYWDVNDWGRLYARGSSLPQYKILGMDNVAIGYYPGLQREKPIIMAVSINGAYYTKLVQGNSYTPGQDRLQDGGQWADSQTGQIMYTVASGMAGLRGYQYDFRVWKDERAKSALNTRDKQTGTDPFGVGPERWKAISASFNLIKDLEPYILQPQANALNLGETIATGARNGSNGSLFMAVSFNENITRHNIDLSHYTNGSKPGMRYRILGSKVTQQSIGNATRDVVELLPSETVIYVFPSGSQPVPNVPVITPPTTPATTTPVVPVPVTPTTTPVVQPKPVEPNPTPTPTPAPTPTPITPAPINIKPEGLLNEINSGLISGWAIDRDDPPAAVTVRIYVDKNLGTPGASPIEIPKAWINLPGIGPHGFSYQLGNQYRDGQPHQVWVWALDLKDTSGNNNTLLSGSPRTFIWNPNTQPPVVTPAPIPTPTPNPVPVPVPSQGFVGGVNLGGPQVVIDGNLWQSDASARTAGMKVNGASSWNGTYNFTPSPEPDSDTKKMLESMVWLSGDKGFQVQYPLANATYDVYLYMIENYKSNFRKININMEGVQVVSGIGDLPYKSWLKYGPYRVKVSDGVLNMDVLQGGKGDQSLAGFSLFRVE